MLQLCQHLGHHRLHVPRQPTAVGFAQNQRARAAALGCAQRLQRINRVELVAVEEVLGVVDHLAPGRAQERDRLFDHLQVLVERGAHHLGHVQRRSLADDGAGRGAGEQQGLQVLVVFGAAARAAGHTEGGELGVLPGAVAPALEELEVLGVGAWPAAFDVRDAKAVQPVGDAELVLERVGNALTLRAVAQSGVVHFDDGSVVGSLGGEVFHGRNRCCRGQLRDSGPQSKKSPEPRGAGDQNCGNSVSLPPHPSR